MIIDDMITKVGECNAVKRFRSFISAGAHFVGTDSIIVRHVLVRCIGTIFDSISDKALSNALGSIGETMKLVLGIDGTEIDGWIFVFTEITIFDHISHTMIGDEVVASLTSEQLVIVHRWCIAECRITRAEQMRHVLVDVGPRKEGVIHAKTGEIAH